MAIFSGSTAPSACYFGSTLVSAVYSGSTQLWPVSSVSSNLTIARDNGTSTFSAQSPFTRAASFALGDADGLSHYSWTANASVTVTLVFNYRDGDSAGENYYINRTRSGSTFTQAQGTDGTAITVNLSVIPGDVISFSSSGYPPTQYFSNVSVSAT